VSASGEATFYDEWLEHWEAAQQRRAASRRVIHDEDLAYVSTRQDARTAELISARTGFATWGTVTLVSEIPAGHASGLHRHGEEAIYIISGSGCTVAEGRRYPWTAGSALHLPFGVAHQHFNLGSEPVRYLSCMTPDLDHYLGLSRVEQLADRGPTDGPPEGLLEATHDASGTRVVLPLEAATVIGGDGALTDGSEGGPRFDGTPVAIDGIEGMMRLSTTHHHRVVRMMRIGKDLHDFRPRAVEISGLLVEEPGTAGGDHAHMEAHLYVLDGEGYTVIDGERYDWKAGSAIHIPGPQTRHQHVNTGPDGSSMVRIAFGIRYLYEKIAEPSFPYLYFAGKRRLAPAELGN
jgi:gentisate 1,2-dioxygenase